MNQEVLTRVLCCPSLPTLPAVAIRVIELTANAGVSLEELAEVIQHDQALTAKILKTVNSSLYGLRRPCGNINQALVMLGLSTVKSLALSFSLVSSLEGGSHDGFDYVAYWRRGLYTAVAARNMARAAGVVMEDEAFLGGLLQDIGMVALHRALGDPYARVLAQAGNNHRRLAELEIDTFEVQHPDISALLVQRWRLPMELVVSVRYHECPTAAPWEHTDLVRCVGLGNLAHDVLVDPAPGPALHRFRTRCREWFDLEPALVDDQVRKIGEDARQLAPLFHTNTGQYADADAIVARARTQADALSEKELANPSAAESLGLLLADSDHNDPLTGTLQPVAMLSRSRAAFADARANARPIAAVSVLIDGFGRLIASGGAQAVDAVLVETASLIGAAFGHRESLAARLDAAGFTVLLPGFTHAAAFKSASALRAMLESQSGNWTIASAPAMTITASVGVAAVEPGMDTRGVDDLLQAARSAAEAASAEGGNRIRSSTPRAAAA